MYWMGKDIETLPREELIKIIRQLHSNLQAAHETTRKICEIGDMARRARQS